MKLFLVFLLFFSFSVLAEERADVTLPNGTHITTGSGDTVILNDGTQIINSGSNNSQNHQTTINNNNSSSNGLIVIGSGNNNQNSGNAVVGGNNNAGNNNGTNSQNPNTTNSPTNTGGWQVPVNGVGSNNGTTSSNGGGSPTNPAYPGGSHINPHTGSPIYHSIIFTEAI